MVIHPLWVSAAAERITSSVVLRPSLTAVKTAVRESLAIVDIHVLCLVSDLEYLPRVMKTRTLSVKSEPVAHTGAITACANKEPILG